MVDGMPVLAVNRLPHLAQPDLRALAHHCEISYSNWRASLRLENRRSNVAGVAHQAHGAHIECLLTMFQEAAPGVDVVGSQCLFHLANAQPVGDQLGSM